MRHSEIHQNGCHWQLHDPTILEQLPEWLFDPDALATRNMLTGESSGRRSAWFLRFGDRNMVLRHYWRGGMVARISADVYVWTGLERTRPWREWHLLAQMRAAGLPVPVPVAARVSRQGPGYRGDLLTLAIPGAEPLDTVIHAGADNVALWGSIGKTIRRFHIAGFRHADLNVRNILVDAERRIWLIDWDRGTHRTDHDWALGNIARLRRSLQKDPALKAAADRHWQRLLASYETPL
ncbi:3-deoxy-D-manno-octulosonic acid kinase [Natronocella acetinitrilica]|uniref:3-deoxy-D-manno-octulosonic acid kinase n=1 Tax=Natronocella acetinitrilica TaxID=414046 RepID=A0AAE3G0I8_9GAMM|nr:3-deoxy-D-manno-octulosonic acid kinase [Natronocella acetinitrilica]MCP1673170.1 3-deoxy-D-manno-octulosonic acid kinase [Natronocella acetinitrilica]